MLSRAQIRSFLGDAVAWRATGNEAFLLTLIRSTCSGVPHDIGAAYATVASRTGDLFSAIERGLLALPAPERDSVVQFVLRMRRIAAFPLEGDPLRTAIAREFELSEPFGDRVAERQSVEDGPFALAAASDPELPRPVPPWQRHFSASALNAYGECARKWFFKYACPAVEDPGSAATAYGTAFHLALEDFHADFPRPRGVDAGAMRKRIRECITWGFERNRDGFDTRVEFDLQVRRAQRTAQRYVDWLLTQEAEAPFEVLARELPANLELEGKSFVGYIDRVDRDERSGGVAVVDYKTGSIATSAEEYRKKVRSFGDFQLPFYYWARTAAGDRVTKLVFVPLRTEHVNVRPIVLDVVEGAAHRPGKKGDARGPIGVDELERSRARMIELSGRLASGEITDFSGAADAGACRFCSFATACTRRLPVESPRFGG